MPTNGKSMQFLRPSAFSVMNAAWLGVVAAVAFSSPVMGQDPRVTAPSPSGETELDGLPSGDSAVFRQRMLAWAGETHPKSTIKEREKIAATAGSLRISSPFGRRADPLNGGGRHHSGVDLPSRTGTNVYATGNGQVVVAGWGSGYGKLVEIEHAGGVRTRFGHLSAILVKDGSTVRQGQLIGKVGSTGRSTGPHLHYEIRIGGAAVDPMMFMGRAVPEYETAWAAERTAKPRWTGWTDAGTNSLPESVIK